MRGPEEKDDVTPGRLLSAVDRITSALAPVVEVAEWMEKNEVTSMPMRYRKVLGRALDEARRLAAAARKARDDKVDEDILGTDCDDPVPNDTSEVRKTRKDAVKQK